MAAPKPRHANLKLIEGRGNGRDSGGRKIKTPPAFTRKPPKRPKHLSPIALELWDRVCEELPRLGLLKDIDGPALEMLCETYAVWRQAVDVRQKKGVLGKNSQGIVEAPWLKVERESAKEFRALCAEFGLTPSAEMRLAGPSTGTGEPNADNPFAGS